MAYIGSYRLTGKASQTISWSSDDRGESMIPTITTPSFGFNRWDVGLPSKNQSHRVIVIGIIIGANPVLRCQPHVRAQTGNVHPKNIGFEPLFTSWFCYHPDSNGRGIHSIQHWGPTNMKKVSTRPTFADSAPEQESNHNFSVESLDVLQLLLNLLQSNISSYVF
jgi:hypothetical protein